MNIKFKYWGYLHSTGTIYVKYFFSQSDVYKAELDKQIELVVHPFEARNREEAYERIEHLVRFKVPSK